jgi:hypothetical protein
VDVVAGEVPPLGDGQHQSVGDRAERFEEVEGEAVPVPLVGVHDPKARVEPEGLKGEAGFSFSERVAVVEHRVDRVCSDARTARGDRTLPQPGVAEHDDAADGALGAGYAAYESVNSRIRDECLNINIFWSLVQARVVISDWKEDYSHRRRHSSLGYQAATHSATPASALSGRCGGPSQALPEPWSLSEETVLLNRGRVIRRNHFADLAVQRLRGIVHVTFVVVRTGTEGCGHRDRDSLTR